MTDGNGYAIGREDSLLAVAIEPAPRAPEPTPRKRVVRLRIIGGHVDLRADVPATREDCPVSRPCGHIKCEWHLWLVAGEDRPGRRAKTGETNRTTELRPVWLEWPLPPSCGRDLIEMAERGKLTVEQMAEGLGVTASGFRYLLVKAVEKLKRSTGNLHEFAGEGEAGDGP